MRNPGTLRKIQFGIIQFGKIQFRKICEQIGGKICENIGGKMGGQIGEQNRWQLPWFW